MTDPYVQREDERDAEDERYDRHRAQERRDRAREKAPFFLPAHHERDPGTSCGSCGAPIGSRCACYCRSEHGS